MSNNSFNSNVTSQNLDASLALDINAMTSQFQTDQIIGYENKSIDKTGKV
jgi:hypothetical protein